MEQFDVFLCHNSKDKPAVIQVAQQLQENGIKPWLDIWHLRPGFSWQDSLEEQINEIRAAAVFVGNSGFGPWQSQEIKSFLRAFVNRKCPVIPVLLPDAPQEPKLPVFLQGLMWVDFRLQYPEPMEQLIWGITGMKPGTHPVTTSQNQSTKTDDLSSEKGIDYSRLRDLLKAGKWKEADKETYRVMIQAVGKKDGDWFTSDELLNFPCTDLCTIDRLWVRYSNGHFGFSVQKEIYLSVGGKPDGKYYQVAWNRFGDRVGWRVKSKWIYYINVTFDTLAPKGHLPVIWWGGWFSGKVWVLDMGLFNGWVVGGSGRVSSLASRLVKCSI